MAGPPGFLAALRAPRPLRLKPSGEFLKTAHWAVFLTEFHLIGSSPAPCSKNGKKIGPLSPIRPKGSERKPGASDCPAAWPSVLRYAPCHAQGTRWRARPARSVDFAAVRQNGGTNYSTVTLFAKLRGWSTSHPRAMAISRANSCSGTLAVMALKQSRTFGIYIT